MDRSMAMNAVEALAELEFLGFDEDNVEIWIRRIENAFAILNVTSPQAKFFHLDRIFVVNEDEVIDEYVYGKKCDAKSWDAFLVYLRSRYGRTDRQQALSVINGTPRDGRTPSQLAAIMKEKAGEVTSTTY